MGLNLEQKQAVVAEIAKQVAGAQAIVMVENRGMAVADMTKLRAKARASGVYFRVVKNTLVRRAVEKTPFATMADRMVGPLAYGIGPDPVAVAKVLNDFAKGNEKFVITGGGMPGQLMSAKQIGAAAAVMREADREADGNVSAGRGLGAHVERRASSSFARSRRSAAKRRRRPPPKRFAQYQSLRFRRMKCPQCKPKFSDKISSLTVLEYRYQAMGASSAFRRGAACRGPAPAAPAAARGTPSSPWSSPRSARTR